MGRILTVIGYNFQVLFLTGIYMANVILEQLGREALVDVVRNPFKFFDLYNKAARKDGHVPVYSKESIELIKELENKYSLSL